MSAAVLAMFLASHIQSIDLGQVEVYCSIYPQAVPCDGHKGRMLPLRTVTAVDARLRAQFRYQSGTVVVGAYRGTRGNCQDYAWTLSERLAEAGEDGRYMWEVSMVQCDPGSKPRCAAHDRLRVLTERGPVDVDTIGPPSPPRDDGVAFATMQEDGNQLLVPSIGFVQTLTSVDMTDGAEAALRAQARR